MRTFGLAAASIGAVGYRLVVGGELTLDTGLGRRIRPLGPLTFTIAAPRETVFDVIAAPYLGRTPRAMAEEIEVLERGGDMVLAAHRTPVAQGMVATTIETVRFDRPETVAFRLLRGPVPHVMERFTLHDDAGSTRLDYLGDRLGFPRARPRRSRTESVNQPQAPGTELSPSNGLAAGRSHHHPGRTVAGSRRTQPLRNRYRSAVALRAGLA